MLVPGSFDVSANGAAGYTIPIPVLPGTAGMAPSLTLGYSSQSGNGLEGVGWSLGGLPSIGRCAKTQAQDGARGSVNYDANDRFCMEGQRLVLVSGTYGAAGSEYRTEIEGFSKITATGTAGTGPASFTVRTKSGQIMEFGNTADSRILAQGKTTARSWAVNKISDTKGNYLTVTYQNDTANGQAYPTRIDYTGNAAAGLSPYNSVQFVYETRPDIGPLYHAGSLMKTTVRLADIRTYSGATLYADYHLTYEQSPTTANSRLVSVKACADATLASCLPPTTFSYSGTTYSDGGADGFSVSSATLPSLSIIGVGWIPFVSDVDSDGRTDVLWVGNGSTQSTRAKRILWLSNVDGSFSSIANVAGQDGSFTYDDGSGIGHDYYNVAAASPSDPARDDLFWYRTRRDATHPAARVPSIWIPAGGGVYSLVSANLPAPDFTASNSHLTAYLGDWDADGRSDILWGPIRDYANGLGGAITGSVTPWLAIGGNSFQPYSQFSGLVGKVSTVADFDGDGKSDIFVQNLTSNRQIALSNGDDTFVIFSNIAGADGQYATYATGFGDFNGDGVTDVFLYDGTGNWLLWFSKGDGTFQVLAPISDSTINGYGATILDTNSDGRADVLWSNTSNNHRILWLSKGDGTFRAFNNVLNQDGASTGTTVNSGDFNGDGKPDMLLLSLDSEGATTGYWGRLWLSDGVPSDLLTSWTTGLGLTTSVTYKPLTDGAVYTKDTNATYPTIDVQGAAYVVSRVDAPNGSGGTYSSSYTYAGAKADANGRGFLGFRQRIVADLQTSIMQMTTYRQDFPYIGLVASETKKLGALTLNSLSNTYGATSLGGTRNFIGLSQSIEASTDLDGTAMPSATTSYQYDAYGNPTQVTISTPDGASKVTTNTYTNDTVNWFLGRLTGASVTSTVP